MRDVPVLLVSPDRGTWRKGPIAPVPPPRAERVPAEQVGAVELPQPESVGPTTVVAELEWPAGALECQPPVAQTLWAAADSPA